MISLSEAIKIVLDSAKPLSAGKILFTESQNRVLAENIFSDINMPPFDKSAMDGFACRSEDIFEILEVIETIPAGKFPQKTIGRNQCSRIMTGAPLPAGADCVLMVEQTEKINDSHIRFTGSKTAKNICFLGEDIKKGDLAIAKGTLIQKSHIAIMAAVGKTQPLVYHQPKISVIATGNEIVEPDSIPGMGQIRNSNAYQMIAQVKEMGINPDYAGIAPDLEEKTQNFIESALAASDVVLLSGGVSMGDFDHIPNVMRSIGVDIRFQKIAVQPGKPTTFGTFGDKYIFGLPGNPVSAFIQFELVVKPLVYKLMGHDFQPKSIPLPMEEDYIRKQSEREKFFPVSITKDLTVLPVEYNGSAHIFALGNADGIVSIKPGISVLSKGETVHVRPI